MLLVFTKTKTIQFGERALKVPLVAIPGSPLCPVSAYQQMVSTIPAPDTAAAFSHVVAGELKPYTYSKFQKKLKKRYHSDRERPPSLLVTFNEEGRGYFLLWSRGADKCNSDTGGLGDRYLSEVRAHAACR